MKESNYNFFIEKKNKNGIIAYNSFTSAMVEMTMEEFVEFEQAKINGYNSLKQDVFEVLKKNGFIIEEDYNEIEAIECGMLKAKYSNDNLILTIASTEDCNFRCIYCYEKDSINSKYMDLQTADNIILFIKNRIKHLDSLSITWYGGEPLLNLESIKYISENVIKMCFENNVIYSASMITNGYLLNAKNLDTLISCNIKLIQVTIDGDKETHDQRRFLVGGGSTFDTIIRNLSLIENYNISVYLRINVDKNNFHAVEDVTRAISKINRSKKIKCYLGKVSNSSGCYKDKECFTIEDFSLKNFTFNINHYTNISHMYPNIKNVACGGECINTYVIGSDGAVYKCWEDIGRSEYSVGNINKDIYFYNKANLSYLLNNPTNNSVCRVCRYLPLCMGGCLKRDKGYSACAEIKYTIEAVINEIFDYHFE